MKRRWFVLGSARKLRRPWHVYVGRLHHALLAEPLRSTEFIGLASDALNLFYNVQENTNVDDATLPSTSDEIGNKNARGEKG